MMRRLKEQRGMVLPMALGIMLVVGILTAAVIDYSVTNGRSAVDSHQRVVAYDAAEQGMNDALSVLYKASDFHSSSALPARSNVSVGQNTSYSYSATFVDPVWTITSIGTAPNKTQGSRPVTWTMKRSIRISPSAGQGVDISVWNYIYSDAPPGSCLTLSNNSTIATPFYIRGDLCLNNNAHMDANTTFGSLYPTTPQLQVGGKITLANGAYIGTSAARLNKVQTGLGCGSTPHNPCTTADNVWANAYSTTTPALTKPVIDMATWYRDASPGPNHACTSGTFPGGFDGNTTQDNSLGTVNLTPLSAYDCKFVDSLGNQLGRIAWTPGSPGTLTVSGTLFWDGNLLFNTSAIYSGRAALYFAGSIVFNNSAYLCGIAGCTSAWDTTSNLIVMVAGSNAQSPSFAFDMQNNAVFQGASMAGGDFNETNNVGVWGSVIAHQVFIANNASDHYVPFGLPVPGQPAQSGFTEALTLSPNSFSG
jgi:Tfp pilus assembly protein PilX